MPSVSAYLSTLLLLRCYTLLSVGNRFHGHETSPQEVMGHVWDIVLVFVGASFAVPMRLLTIDYWLRYGSVEYRISEDAIVAYDRLFQTRVWRIEPWDERGVRVERDRIHRWLDTSTVVIECSDREFRLPHLHDPESILDVFDRRISGV